MLYSLSVTIVNYAVSYRLLSFFSLVQSWHCSYALRAALCLPVKKNFTNENFQERWFSDKEWGKKICHLLYLKIIFPENFNPRPLFFFISDSHFILDKRKMDTIDFIWLMWLNQFEYFNLKKYEYKTIGFSFNFVIFDNVRLTFFFFTIIIKLCSAIIPVTSSQILIAFLFL